MNLKKRFLKYQAQTSENPIALEVAYAKGNYVYDTKNKAYLDFIAGVSANSLGHGYSKINVAIKKQLKYHTHVMVYGEFIQKEPLQLCELLVQHLPKSLNCVYLTNSGTEATEGALKLAKRYTGRSQIIAAKNAYHGNTQGAMSVSGVEAQKSAFRPLIPDTSFINYNDVKDIEKITQQTAAVILETIQGGAGFVCPKNDYLKKVKRRCEQVGALLILDEIQTGVGRTGTLYAFEHYNVVPDILITGKGLGGGMPIGAFISDQKKISRLQTNPVLGHITTFGGHPLIAAAAHATLSEIVHSGLIKKIHQKEKLIRSLLQHKSIVEIRGKGLMLALLFSSSDRASKLISKARDKGLLLFGLLFEKRAVRITPALNISKKEIKTGCRIILEILG